MNRTEGNGAEVILADSRCCSNQESIFIIPDKLFIGNKKTTRCCNSLIPGCELNSFLM